MPRFGGICACLPATKGASLLDIRGRTGEPWLSDDWCLGAFLCIVEENTRFFARLNKCGARVRHLPFLPWITADCRAILNFTPSWIRRFIDKVDRFGYGANVFRLPELASIVTVGNSWILGCCERFSWNPGPLASTTMPWV
jgi:hypothetical protein